MSDSTDVTDTTTTAALDPLIVVPTAEQADILQQLGFTAIAGAPPLELVAVHRTRGIVLIHAPVTSAVDAVELLKEATQLRSATNVDVRLANAPADPTLEAVQTALAAAVPTDAASWANTVKATPPATRATVAATMLADLRFLAAVKAGGCVARDLSVKALQAAGISGDTLDACVAELTAQLPRDPNAENGARAGLRTRLDDHADFLQFDADGVLRKTPANVALVLAYDHEFGPDANGIPCLAYDDLHQSPVWRRPPPDTVGLPVPTGMILDHHIAYVRAWLLSAARCDFSDEITTSGIIAGAHVHEFNPITEYLNSCTWDGVERLSSWLHTYLGTEPTPINADIGRWWLISAIARAFEPGCRVDHMLVLEGIQGIKKSTALQILGGPWYSSGVEDIRSKDGPQSLRGKWIVEIGELDALRGRELSTIKDFLSKTNDVYRPSFGRATITAPRRNVFAGSTNEDTYLHDATGARRFWPTKTGVAHPIDVDALSRDRDQLFAEAVAAYRWGEPWWPSTKNQEKLVEVQSKRYAEDAWTDEVHKYLTRSRVGKMEPEVLRLEAEYATIGEVLSDCLYIPLDRFKRSDEMRIAAIFKRLGWERRRLPAKTSPTRTPAYFAPAEWIFDTTLTLRAQPRIAKY